MDRKVLFQGKCLDNGKWVTGYYTCFNNKEHRIYTGYAETDCGDYYPDWWSVDPDTVGQYSGMNDTDRAPIFDGCILQVERILSGTKKTLRAVVRFENGAFIMEYRPGSWDYLNIIQDPLKVRSCKVIGNVHDNPTQSF